jgi:hypothetical protein
MLFGDAGFKISGWGWSAEEDPNATPDKGAKANWTKRSASKAESACPIRLSSAMQETGKACSVKPFTNAQG